MVSALTFKCLIHFELIFVSGHSFACGCLVFPVLFIEETVISTFYVTFTIMLFHNLIVHVCESLFLESQFCFFLTCVSVFVPVPYCLDSYSFVVYLE